MKFFSSLATFSAALLATAFLSGCLQTSDTTPAEQAMQKEANEEKPGESAQSAQDSLAALKLVTAKALGDSQQITALRKAGYKAGDEVLLQGRVGGRRNPFLGKNAAFVLVDGLAVDACDALPDDPCPYPWDFCCVPSGDLLQASALIQVVDENGKVRKISLDGYEGIKAGAHIQVRGKIADKATEDNLLVNASEVFIVAAGGPSKEVYKAN